jgi:hypothetical protein
LQKKIIRIIADTQRSESCKDLFSRFCILPLASEYIFALMILMIDNYDIFQPVSEVLKIDTRHKYDLHIPSTNLTVYQKDIFYAGIKLYNKLTVRIKNLFTNKAVSVGIKRLPLVTHLFC